MDRPIRPSAYAQQAEAIARSLKGEPAAPADADRLPWVCACNACPGFATFADQTTGEHPRRWCSFHFDIRSDARACDHVTSRMNHYRALVDAVRLSRLVANDPMHRKHRAALARAVADSGFADEVRAGESIEDIAAREFAAPRPH